MPKVYFSPSFENILKVLEKFKIPERVFPIKLHMGEIGNKYAINPEYVRKIYLLFKEKGFEPFLFDTVVAYSSPRSTKQGYLDLAKRRGFNFARIVIGDKGPKRRFEDLEIEIAKEIAESEFILILSHVKGHELTGFGGAIKNVGMGCVSKKSKIDLHSKTSFNWESSKCIFCKTCVNSCPSGALTFQDSNLVLKGNCIGCGICMKACPTKAIKISGLQRNIAISCKLCLENKEYICINWLGNITKYCDCNSDPGPIVCQDIGWLVGRDIVAVDAASLWLIEKKCGKIFERLHGIDPWLQIETAEEIGLGSSKFEIIKV